MEAEEAEEAEGAEEAEEAEEVEEAGAIGWRSHAILATSDSISSGK